MKLIYGNSVRGTGVDDRIVRWDGTQFVQSSLISIDDSGNITGSASITQGNIVWNNVNGFVSSADMNFTSDGTMTFSTGPSPADLNFVSFAGSINIVSDLDNTMGSVSGGFIFNAATDISLNAGGSIVMNSEVNMLANFLRFGSSGEAAINYSTNLIIDPAVSGSGIVFIGDGSTPESMQIYHMGVGADAPVGGRMISMTETGGVATGIFCALTHNSNTASIRGMSFTATHAGSATSPSAASQFVATHTNDSSGTTTMLGVLAQATNGAAVSQGTKVYESLRASTSIGGGHSGGTIRSYGLNVLATGGSAGSAALTDWGILCAGDLQVNTGFKVYYEGSSTAKGDSYDTFNNSTTQIERYVDNVLSMAWDNDEVISKLDFKLDVVGTGIYIKEGTDATMGVDRLSGGVITISTTKITANSRVFVSRQAQNSGNLGHLSIENVNAGSSFDIQSNDGNDDSDVAWIIIEPA